MLTRRLCLVVMPLLLDVAASSAFAQASPAGPPANDPAPVQGQWSSPDELRAEYSRLLGTLSRRVPESDQSAWAVDLRQQIASLQTQVNGLSAPELEQLSQVTNRDSFTTMMNALAAGEPRPTGSGPFGPAAAQQLDTTRSTQSVIPGTDYSSAVSGTTCSTSPTPASTIDGEKIGLYVDRGLSLIADVACQSMVVILGEGTNLPFCIAFGITRGIEVVLDSLIDHQEFCNSLLDGADAAANAANVVNVHDDVTSLDGHLTSVNDQITGEFSAVDNHLTAVDNHLTAVDNHLTNVDNHISDQFSALDAHLVALFGQLSEQVKQSTDLLNADLRQVMKLELTPDGRRRIVPEILTCSGSNCPNVLADCPAAGCSWNNVGPLP